MKAIDAAGTFVLGSHRVEHSSAFGVKKGSKVQLGSKFGDGILGRRSEAGFQGPYMKYMGLGPLLSLGRRAQGSVGGWTRLLSPWLERMSRTAMGGVWLTRVGTVMGTEVCRG